ncbi:MAG: AraC family transcriptional regulator [Parasphingopyxis sp.]|uniref:helix-turn-helix domain-containing protein n=1 Tax=Parasphingopyxis sp. TaxID=1920299 RepID=UPI0026094CB7|nr:AraC family transcriptional regulator [uncultured Parasphingopyxis sp.]
MDDLSKFSLEYAAPADDLKELVSSFYHFRADVEETRQTERADRAQFRFLLSGSGGYEFHDGSYHESSLISIIGPTTGPTIGHIKGPLEIFGAGLQPAGWGTLMGTEGHKHSDSLIDAIAVFGEGLLQVRDALIAAPTMAAKVEIANEFARGLLSRADSAPFWFTRTVDKWLLSDASPKLEDLIAETGLSKRQVERMTKRFYGATPKLLARKHRALRAASALVRNDPEGADTAAEGFYDQSHLIRELKQFTGFTPGKMRASPPELNRRVAEGRKGLSGQVDPLVSDS